MEPVLLTIDEAARKLRIGRTKTYELMGQGELQVVRIGRAVRIPATEVERWVHEHMEKAPTTRGA